MTQLIIKRPSHRLSRKRAYRLFVNGQHLGKIKDGEIFKYPLEPGNHILKTEIDWLRTQTLVFEIKPNENKILEVKGGRLGYLLLPLYLLCLLGWYILQKFMQVDYFLLWAAHLVLYILIMVIFLFRKQRYVRELQID